MQRTTPPFRADHVGSLLRPEWLHAARAERAAGKISAEELRAVTSELADLAGVASRIIFSGQARQPCRCRGHHNQ